MIDGYRKVALKLHAMGAEDRGWMLQQFGDDERTRLAGLLRELQDLGIRSDLSVPAALSDEDARQLLLSSAGVDRAETEKALDAVRSAQPAEVATLLTDEPDAMIAAVLSAYPWPWRARMLAGYGVETRLRVNRALAQTDMLRPKVRAALIRLMAARLSTLRAQAFPAVLHVHEEPARTVGAARKRPIWHGLKRWLP